MAMSCRRFYLRRKFMPYLEGELTPHKAKRLEKHLLDCEWCRAKFVRLRAGHHLAQQLHYLRPDGAHRPPEFETMMADFGETATGRRKWTRVWESWLDALTTPRAAQVLTVLVLVQLALLVVSNRRVLFGERMSVTAKPSALDFSDFHHLSIPELKSNTKPRIATEGYVRDVYADKEEGTLHFKLVENPQGSEPFVVCEIINSIEMTVPRKGSRVRVYGVARFDGQTDRMWYEVNPVLNIAVLKR
jgi:hypothetical protein